MNYDYVILDNIALDTINYKINDHIQLFQTKKSNKTILLAYKDYVGFENNIALFLRCLQIALPKISIRLGSEYKPPKESMYEILKNSTGHVMNRYDSPSRDSVDYRSHTINKEDIDSIKRTFEIVVTHNKNMILNEENEFKSNRWGYAYQQYLTACAANTIQDSVLHLITGLETLLVKGSGLLTYKVALNASLILEETEEKREKVFEVIKRMYNLRSKVVHGEVKEMSKQLAASSTYDNYYELKSILSRILVKIYNISEDQVFDRIKTIIFKSPKF
ncbi:HEPN domain-containing protein [Bacillus subtilis]|uniref:Apea-like HEPN domain-containing protein n=1 Tax=Bacillus subtilis subsp. subtilis TaxID=135461 RepID=A0ABD3ZRA0_BACIU|nr:HEPN domain-containing protein [Bacillus subtilis]KIL30504.1 hypothetical protein B4067_4801 [Bacillus subtilis subsp. subtilis]KIN46326.1 hypothetical protein B4145_3596 [Bacillus subtilis]